MDVGYQLEEGTAARAKDQSAVAKMSQVQLKTGDQALAGVD